ncbi:MAG: TetR/AcrR family transcriptional regulator [Sphingomonadales bacterium]|nr:MAG: TetR/AcrR family transcriptional regulator [Sphingomonadales bacterium]
MSSAKKPFHHGNLKAVLLEAALDILDATGPDSITIREVARRAGVSHAAPANHFQGLRSLLTELTVQLFGQLAVRIERGRTDIKRPGIDNVRIFATSLIEFGLEHPARYRMLWRRDLTDNDDTRLTAAMDRIYDALIEEILRLRHVNLPDPHTLAIGLWSLAHGYVSMRLDGNFEAVDDAVSGAPRDNAMIDMFLSSVQGD